MKKDVLKNRKIVIFDMKTTEEGLNSEILYFASRTYINNEMISKDNFFIRTMRPIPAHIIRKYRITNKKINSDGISKESALEKIASIFQDGIIFTFNGDNFMFPLIEKTLLDNGYTSNISSIDALKLAKQIIGFDDDLTLEELSSKLGIMYNGEKLLSAPYCTILLEKIWFRLKSFII